MPPARPVAVVTAAFLGWTLDAFDFFLMVFVFGDVARSFGVSQTSVSLTITLTLAMRTVGALGFGLMADRFGRRPVLMASVLGYSALEFASGLAPNFLIFLLLRAAFGVAMGGEWGAGASLTMESVPTAWRGRVSGVLQAGYPAGNLLATLLYAVAGGSHGIGWRAMFMLGALPALLVLFIRARVPESPAFHARRQQPRPALWPLLRRHTALAGFAIVMMAGFNALSHGTQDLYPHYLQAQRHFSHATVAGIAIAYTISALLGGLAFATLSQKIGRGRAIALAALLAILVTPLWGFAVTPWLVGVGAVLMQFCVQGAWGVVPAHLNELSPAEIRGTFPGVVYQLGNLLAAAVPTLQSAGAGWFGADLRWPFAATVIIAACVVILAGWFGPDRREARLVSAPTG